MEDRVMPSVTGRSSVAESSIISRLRVLLIARYETLHCMVSTSAALQTSVAVPSPRVLTSRDAAI